MIVSIVHDRYDRRNRTYSSGRDRKDRYDRWDCQQWCVHLIAVIADRFLSDRSDRNDQMYTRHKVTRQTSCLKDGLETEDLRHV